MKRIYLLSGAVTLVLAACNAGAPLSSGSDFDPLVAPGVNRSGVPVASTGLKKGTFVRAIMDNAAFFKVRPRGNADADKLLTAGTEMKVISDDSSYVKVELNSGEVGFVPSVQVTDETAAPALAPVTPTVPGQVQVYPPLPGTTPIPGVTETPAIPPVIDPEAPVVTPEVPPAAPSSVETVPATPPVEKPAGE